MNGPSSYDEALNQDLTTTDFPEAGLAAHQGLTESWPKAIVSETITKTYEKARVEVYGFSEHWRSSTRAIGGET